MGRVLETDVIAQQLEEEAKLLEREIARIRADSDDSRPPTELIDQAHYKIAQADAERDLERATDRLEEVRAAQERIREGTYGTCESCGRRIQSARLEVLPTTRRCVADAA